MTGDSLLVRTCETVAAYLALGNETFLAHGATFVRNRSTPSRFDANHVGRIRTADPVEFDALIARAEAEFQDFGYLRFDIDPLTPPAFEARLRLDGGYSVSEGLHLLLEGALSVTPRPYEIREVVSADDWAAYDALDRLWWDETRNEVVTEELIRDSSLQKRLKARLGVRYWLACIGGEARAFLASWPGENGVGMVEDLFTHPDYRHRGLATALIAHCVADARARGAGPVVIGADPHDTPRQMYAALGFRPLFLSRGYLRRFPA
jgi:GNAT superfamily N-acetyltransferase